MSIIIVIDEQSKCRCLVDVVNTYTSHILVVNRVIILSLLSFHLGGCQSFSELDPSEGVSATSGKNSGAAKSGIVRLSSIREVMNRGKHALLDVTPNAVDKLNYAQFYPIVILAKADSKQTIKEIRAGVPK